jgi:hypothetical protein
MKQVQEQMHALQKTFIKQHSEVLNEQGTSVYQQNIQQFQAIRDLHEQHLQWQVILFSNFSSLVKLKNLEIFILANGRTMLPRQINYWNNNKYNLKIHVDSCNLNIIWSNKH